MKVRSKSRKVNRAWLADHVNDPYVKMAQRDGYRARAAYKLEEIDEALGLVKPGMRIVDLGCAPGAWSQYLRRRMGHGSGLIVGVDILPCEPVDGVTMVQGDFREPEVLERVVGLLGGRPADLVLSDMAPNLSGIASADAARMAHLLELAVDFACAHLTPAGSLVAKAFHGSGYSQTVRLFKDRFRVVKPIKPQASRARSAETFLLGQGPKAA
jgi:23S rRNA (uridine2552-2'-O)-methyltransferase